MTIWISIDTYDCGRSVRGLMVDPETIDADSEKLKRPTYHQHGWVVCDLIHEWLAARVSDYQLGWSNIEAGHWHVGIEDPDVALLFKLTWG